MHFNNFAIARSQNYQSANIKNTIVHGQTEERRKSQGLWRSLTQNCAVKKVPSEPFNAPMATHSRASQKIRYGQSGHQFGQPDAAIPVMTQDRPGTTRESEMNMGESLASMRREQAEKKDAELWRVKEIRDTDKMLHHPDAAAIPKRWLCAWKRPFFVGIPWQCRRALWHFLVLCDPL
jgi:hypothetical protein